ncbi:hypothetical protein CsSME_00027685 [Camellia sinensis var. sinensis]
MAGGCMGWEIEAFVAEKLVINHQNGERNGEPFVDEDVPDIDKAASQHLNQRVGVIGGADSDGGAVQPSEAEPSLANERAGGVAGLGVQLVEDLEDQLVW